MKKTVIALAAFSAMTMFSVAHAADTDSRIGAATSANPTILTAEEAKLSNNLKSIKYMPVVQLGVGYRF